MAGPEFIIVLYDVDTKHGVQDMQKNLMISCIKLSWTVKQRSTKIEFDIGFHILDGKTMTADDFLLAAGRKYISECG